MKKAFIFQFIGFILIIISLLIIIYQKNNNIEFQILQCPKFRQWFA